MLRKTSALIRSLKIERLRDLGFEDKVTYEQAAMLNEMPSTDDITKSGDIELQKMMKITSRRMGDLITNMEHNQTQTEESIKNYLHELLGLNKQLRRIRGQLKVAVAKKLDLEEKIEEEKGKLAGIENHPDYTDVQRKEFRNRIKELNDDLKVRQEHIDLLKGDLSNQTTSIKEMIAKVLNKDTSLGEKIRTLFIEQGNFDCFHSHSYWNGYWCTH